MPHVEIPQAEFKAVILGDSHIGKTSLVTRFAEGYYRENSRPATVGAFFVTKRIQSTANNIPTKIQIWDTAGAESFRAMAPMFYKNAAAVVVCYDVTRRDSFEGMREWLDEVRRKVKVGDEVVVAIAALKMDLLQESNAEPAVPEHEVEQLAEALGCIYLPTSAKTNHNVETLFLAVADRVLQNQQNRMVNGDIGQGTDNAVLMDRHDLSHTNSMNNESLSSDRITITSPRKRDEFDKYYVGKDSKNTEDPNKNDGSIQLDKITKEMQRSKSRKNSGKSSSSKSVRRSKSNRSNTASTDGTGETEGDHPLLAKEKSKNKKKGSSKTTCPDEEGLCQDDSFYNCQPVACGAGDGGPGCVVQ